MSTIMVRGCELPGYDVSYTPQGCCGRGMSFGLRKEGGCEVFTTRLTRDLGFGPHQYDITVKTEDGEAVEWDIVRADGDGVSGEEIQNAKVVLYIVRERWPKEVPGYDVQALYEAAGRVATM